LTAAKKIYIAHFVILVYQSPFQRNRVEEEKYSLNIEYFRGFSKLSLDNFKVKGRDLWKIMKMEIRIVLCINYCTQESIKVKDLTCLICCPQMIY